MSTPNKVGFTSATAGLLTDVDSVAVGGATNIYRNIPGTYISDDAGNEYMYMLGVAATVAGSFVTYSSVTFQTALTTNSATNAGPVAIAMAAILAAQYGWYLIGGTYASANVATSSAIGQCLYTSATAGRLSVTAVAAQAVFGAFLVTASVANVGGVFVQSPFTMQNSTL